MITKMTKEYGEIVVLSNEEEFPKGIVLRETGGTVVLEEYLDTTGLNVNVLNIFYEGCKLSNKMDFYDCLAVAREKEPDYEVPIFIIANSCITISDEEENNLERKKACFLCMLTHNQQRPYELMPLKEKCDKCLAICKVADKNTDS